MKKRPTTSSPENNQKLPKWALVKLRLLAKQSGVSFDRILKMVLQFGLYQVKDELTPLMNLMESADHLEDDEEPHEPERQVEPVPDEPSTITAFDVGLSGFEEGSGDAVLGRGDDEQSVPDSQLFAGINGTE